MEALPRDEAKRQMKREMRSRLLTFEQLSSGQMDSAPARQDKAVARKPGVAEAALPARRGSDRQIETNPSLSDPCHRVPGRSLSDPSLPSRSRLSPSQRALLHRPGMARDRSGRLGYVTYTVDN